jgi:AraC-like DNA-binding protein
MTSPDSGTRYIEAPPSAALAPWVASYWSITGALEGMRSERVLPDGCADVIIDLGTGRDPYAVGAMRRALVITLTSRLDMFGVRFQPGGALPFLDNPLHELTDRLVPLDSLWGSLGTRLGDAFAGASPHERIPIVERILLGRLRNARADDALAVRAADLFRRSRGGASVRAVAAALGVGERRLERVFDRCVGLTPKGLARVARFAHAVRSIERRSGAWTTVALESGYADQAHFIREFRSLAGVTPTSFVDERKGVGIVQYPGEAGP